jgi:hypothetical protein
MEKFEAIKYFIQFARDNAARARFHRRIGGKSDTSYNNLMGRAGGYITAARLLLGTTPAAVRNELARAA